MKVLLCNGNLLKDDKGYIYELNNNVKYKEVRTLSEASREVLKYIDDNCLGNSTFSGGDVYDDKGELIARVSYNGRLWGTNGNLLK